MKKDNSLRSTKLKKVIKTEQNSDQKIVLLSYFDKCVCPVPHSQVTTKPTHFDNVTK